MDNSSHKQSYSIIDTQIESNFKVDCCFCSCFPSCNKNCPNYGQNEEELKQKIILTIEDNKGKRFKAECEIKNIIFSECKGTS